MHLNRHLTLNQVTVVQRTRVTDRDVKIDTMLRDSPSGVINHVETTWIPGVTCRYSSFLQTTHSCVIRPSKHLHDF